MGQRRWVDAATGRATARSLAAGQRGVVSRRQLVKARVPRWLVRHEVSVGRWRTWGAQVIAVHNGPLDAAALRWVAVLSTCPRAALDGVSALQEAGIVSLTDDSVHVIAPKGSAPRRSRGVVVHESRRYRPEDVVRTGLPRTKPAVAAVHAALWSRTTRQASFFLVLVVQQRLATPADVYDALADVRRHRFRPALLVVVDELAHGVRSLHELDIARDFRRRGFPEPSRQVLRQRPSGREYLDLEIEEYGITVEVDGAQHDDVQARIDDSVRDLRRAAEGSTPLRLPMLAYRLAPDRFLDAVEEVLRSRGWRPASEAA